MGDALDDLIKAVEAGRYDRPSGVPRYYDFGEDSAGIVPGARFERMRVLTNGNIEAVAILRALQAKSTPDADTAAIRSDGHEMTARQIIEARLGRPLGPIATMPRDLRRALYLLALQLVRVT